MLEGNQLPVKMFSRGDMLVAAFPMPGLEPQDISVMIEANNTLKVQGAGRDKRGGDVPGILLDEWNIGPYERTLELPFPVDGTITNVTYGNGVLVISMPKSDKTQAASLTLDRLNSTTGSEVSRESGNSLFSQ